MDAAKNFGIVTVYQGYDAAALSIVLNSGHGAKLPDPVADGAYNLVWYESTHYASPADDPNVEIVRVTGPSGTGDTKTITRAQEGTVASTKNTPASTYKMVLGTTAKTITDVESEIDADIATHALLTNTHGVSEIVGRTESQTLTNKSIDCDNNPVTNISNANIKAAAAIVETKIAFDNGPGGHTHDGIDSANVEAQHVANTPAGSIAATTVQAAIDELDTEKEPTATSHAARHVTGGGDAIADAAPAGNAGLMSGADKTKIDGIADNANNYAHPNHSGDVTSVGDGAQTIINDVVDNTKLANMGGQTIKGNQLIGTEDPQDLTPAQLRSLINVADGADVTGDNPPQSHTHGADEVEVEEIGSATYDDIQDYININQTSGVIDGCLITENAAHDFTIDISAGKIFIKTTDSDVGVSKSCDIAVSTGTLGMSLGENIIYVNYNAGTPIFAVTADLNDIDFTTKFVIGRVYRTGDGYFHIINGGFRVANPIQKLIKSNKEIRGMARVSGMITTTNNLNVDITAGVLWRGLSRFTTESIDSTLNYAIVAVNTGTKKFSISGDHASDFIYGQKLLIDGSTGNDKGYHAVAAVYNNPNTEVEVAEVIPSAVADGNMYYQTFFHIYLKNGDWNIDDFANIEVDNLQYNDVSTPGSEDLATLSNNQYGVHWVYVDFEGCVLILYGQSSYTLTEAENAASPPSVPDWLDKFTTLAAKIIVEKSDTTCTVSTAWDSVFAMGSASNHNDLGGIQGGAADDYYHLTAANRTDLIDGNETTLHKHAASGIVNTPAGSIAATTVQAAIDELDTEKASNTDLSAHESDTTTHGTTTAIVGVDDTQTFKNKTIDCNENTILNLPAAPNYYGVSWDESADTYVRTGSLVGVACGSKPADSLIPIQAAMRRCVMNDSGVVQYYLDPTDSTKKVGGAASDLTGGDGQVMVEIPAFYYKYGYSGTTHTWEISLSPLSGFSLHPAFIKNDEFVPYRYIGAYEGVIYDVSESDYCNGLQLGAGSVTFTNATGVISRTGESNPFTRLEAGDKIVVAGTVNNNGVFTVAAGGTGTQTITVVEALVNETEYNTNITTKYDYVNDVLSSVSGKTPGNYGTRANFRTIAANRGTGWRQQDYDLVSGIQLLYLVEYGSFYSQSMIGAGLTDWGSATWAGYNLSNPIETCGNSNSNGNATANTSNGDGAGGSYMSYRGIENFFGHVWKWVDGMNVGGVAGADDYKVNVSNNDSDFADDTWTGYTYIGLTYGASGYQSTLKQQPRGFLPASVGASSSTKITDYYYRNPGWRVALLGGHASSGGYAGAFFWGLDYASADLSRAIGARICF